MCRDEDSVHVGIDADDDGKTKADASAADDINTMRSIMVVPAPTGDGVRRKIRSSRWLLQIVMGDFKILILCSETFIFGDITTNDALPNL
jgi:hypothetical protein